MPDPRTVATISANGQIFTGWKSLTVRRTYGDMVSTFQFTCSDAKGEAAQLLPGARCTIKLGGQIVLEGWITTRGFAFDAETHDVVIAGKSLTSPVTTSMPVQPGSLNGYTAEQITRGALAPHGIDLNVVNPPPSWSKPFPFFAVDPGESVADHIERALRMRGAFSWDDAQGRLCVGQAQPAAAVADLVEGRNLLRCSGKLDDQTAVSTLSAYGQQPGIGDDMATRNAQAQVSDPKARANTLAVEHMPNPGDSQDAASYASLLAARMGWQTVEIEATVVGWFRPDGSLWQPTDGVTLYSPMALPAGDHRMTLGAQQVTYSQVQNDGGEGTTTTLTLVRPQFLTPAGHAGVASDGAGNIVSDPGPAQPVAPDTGS